MTHQLDGSIRHGKLFDFQPIENKRVEISFTASWISSDGGLLLIKAIENQPGLIKALVSCIEDTRHQSYIDNSQEGIAAQLDYQIARWYKDANDCNTLCDYTILKMSAWHLPMTGNPWHHNRP